MESKRGIPGQSRPVYEPDQTTGERLAHCIKFELDHGSTVRGAATAIIRDVRLGWIPMIEWHPYPECAPDAHDDSYTRELRSDRLLVAVRPPSGNCFVAIATFAKYTDAESGYGTDYWSDDSAETWVLDGVYAWATLPGLPASLKVAHGDN